MKRNTDTMPKLRRRPVTLSIREDIISEAKALSLNASKAAEAGILQALRKAQADALLKQAQPGIDAHNARVAAHGTLIKPYWKN